MTDRPAESLLIVVAPRKRGRPKVEEPLTSISIRLPVHAHARLCAIADKADKSLSALVREALLGRLRP